MGCDLALACGPLAALAGAYPGFALAGALCAEGSGVAGFLCAFVGACVGQAAVLAGAAASVLFEEAEHPGGAIFLLVAVVVSLFELWREDAADVAEEQEQQACVGQDAAWELVGHHRPFLLVRVAVCEGQAPCVAWEGGRVLGEM